MNKSPFLLKPVGKDYLWGGQRLKLEFDKMLDMIPLAETWECSTHKEGESIIASGKFKGRSLKQIIELFPEMLGNHIKNKNEIPILIKFIDANQKLSVQVHPNDEYAKLNENNSLGKTEVWYVIDAKENAELIYGLNCDITKEILEDGIKSGQIEKYLQKIKINKNDVFFIEPGTIHGIGEGVLIAEIQQSSDVTYRLYDYSRKDKYGKTRELHIKKALDVSNLTKAKSPRQPMRVLKYKNGYATELLARCAYFQIERWLINTNDKSYIYKTDTESFQILLCIEGFAVFEFENKQLEISKGDCIFVPADSYKINIIGKAKILNVRC